MKKYIHYTGRKIFYSESGSGFPVLLVHGYLESGDTWKEFQELIAARGYRVIAVDLPGHGQSDIISNVQSMEVMASALQGLLDTLALGKVFITGHSLGGYITLAFAEKYPERLTGFCLMHSHPFPDTPEIIEKREREIMLAQTGRQYLFYPDSIRRMFAERNLPRLQRAFERSKEIAAATRPEGIVAVLKGMMARPSRVSLMENGGFLPYLWILGRYDNYIPCDSMKARVRLPAASELVVLEESGHLGFIEEPGVAAAALTGFIIRHSS